MKNIVVVCAVMAATAVTLAQTKSAPATSARAAKPFSVVEATIPELKAALEAKRVTSREIVRQYLMRIGTYEDQLHAAITVNPKAIEIADERDRERARGTLRGP